MTDGLSRLSPWRSRIAVGVMMDVTTTNDDDGGVSDGVKMRLAIITF
jgi:hypothetical protein